MKNHEHCRYCGQAFGSVRAYEWHLAGPRYTCMSPAEMEKVGIVRGNRGWIFKDERRA